MTPQPFLFPKSLAWLMDYPDGRAWLARLPAHYTHVCQQWNLHQVGPPIEGGRVGYTFPALWKDKQVIVKIQYPHPEAQEEARALRVWNGQGFCHLLDACETQGVLLTERIMPGIPLSALAPSLSVEETTSIASTVLHAVLVETTQPFCTLTDQAQL